MIKTPLQVTYYLTQLYTMMYKPMTFRQITPSQCDAHPNSTLLPGVL